MRWTIRGKLYSTLMVLATMMIALAIITYERFNRTALIEDELKQSYKGQLLAGELQVALLEARRAEKDFIAHGGDEKNLRSLNAASTRFQRGLKELTAVTASADAGNSRELEGVSAAFARYVSTFEKTSRALGERGQSETGAQGRLRKAAHDIEDAAEQIGDERVTIELLQVRRREKDYLLREDAVYASDVGRLAASLEAAIAAGEGHAPERRRMRALVPEYKTSFDGMVAATTELTKLKGELDDAHEEILPKVDKILDAATERTSTRLAEVQEVRRSALVTLLSTFGFVILVGALAVAWVSRQISLGVTRLMDGTRRVAAGDLTTSVELTSNDELGQLAEAFNLMTTGLRDLSVRVNETSSSLASIASELNATVSEQSASVQQQAAAVAETVSTIEQMTRSASSVADTAQGVSNGAAASLDASSRGEAALKQSIDGMLSIRDQVQNIAATILELSEKTQQIGGIIATVDDFAEQSSLLALNASIEAARAGEQGRAFSVVAAEVKKLAEQSQQATDRVRGILSEIQRATHSAVMVTEEGSKRVDRGVGLVEAAGQVVSELVETIKSSARSAKQIAAAAQQQAGGVGQVSAAMAGIDQSSRQNITAIKQTETASKTISDITQQLVKSAAQYRLT